MPDVKGFLTKKVGPLPMGVWIGTVAVGLYVMHKRNQAGQGVATGATDVTAPQASSDQVFPTTPPPGYVPNYGGASGSYYDSGPLGTPQIVVSAPAVPNTLNTIKEKLYSLQQLLAGITAQLAAVNSRLKAISTAMKKYRPGTTQYNTLLAEYRAELSKRDSLTEQKANTAAQIPVVSSQITLLAG